MVNGNLPAQDDVPADHSPPSVPVCGGWIRRRIAGERLNVGTSPIVPGSYLRGRGGSSVGPMTSRPTPACARRGEQSAIELGIDRDHQLRQKPP